MVRTRLLTERERKVLEAYLNLKSYSDKEQRFLHVIFHRVRKLDLNEIIKENQRAKITANVKFFTSSQIAVVLYS
ncbi:MAG: hypothetical protein ABIM44_07470 [candidate division WOR-3 bacterium]